MAEYWYRAHAAGVGQPTLKADMKEAASVANIYGKRFVANESLTVFALQDPWAFSPAMLKPVIDEIFAHGINRIVIHTSVHQPLLGKRPGLTNGPFGQFITRNETWAEQAGPFFSYIARTSYLLQQGRRIADVAYFYGEERPLVSLFEGRYDPEADRLAIEVPVGYDYDFFNAEAIRNETLVANGQLATRSGTSYRLLFLPAHVRALTASTLRRIADLVQEGVVLVAERPTRALGLSTSDREMAALGARLWGSSRSSTGVRTVGKGKVYWGISLDEALKREGAEPDVHVSGEAANIPYVHRRTKEGTDIFFLSNGQAEPKQVTISFRLSGREPRLWHPDSGQASAVSYRIVGGRTEVPLSLAPHESVFVMFEGPATSNAEIIPAPTLEAVAEMPGPWSVRFPPGLGAPASATLPKLKSWSESEVPGIRYFSGTATYDSGFIAQPAWLSTGSRLWVDLGEVREIAEVLINGRSAGILWKAPFKVDVTDLVRPGNNRLEIRVTNLWPNRLVGDARLGQKFTWTSADLPGPSMGLPSARWSAESRLLPSGLLGPVRILHQGKPVGN